MAVEVDHDSGSAAVFATQVVVGTFLFAVVFGAAFGLSWLATQAQAAGAPEWMIKGAHWAEKAVFGLDLFLFALFLLNEALKFVVSLFKEWRP